MEYGCQSMTGKIESILIKRPENAFISQQNADENYEKFFYEDKINYDNAIKEYNEFEKILKNYVKNVHYLPKSPYGGLDSIYTHDPVKITKKGAIYLPMGKDLRSQEHLATKEYLESIGIPTLGVVKSPGKIEGGDILWIDEDTVAIGKGYRTNDEGIRQFTDLIKDFVKNIIIVPLPYAEGENACLHLMSLISFVHPKLAVTYSKYMPVFFRDYLIEKGIKFLEVTQSEYDYLGSNVLALEPNVVVMIKGNPLIKKKLLEENVTVLEYEGEDISFKGTGGPTCLTSPLHRME